MQDARVARRQRCRVQPALHAMPGGLAADEANTGVREERVEQADGVRSPSDARDRGIGQAAGSLEDLTATPCWPAPVSAMTRGLPIRMVSRACPSTLLNLV